MELLKGADVVSVMNKEMKQELAALDMGIPCLAIVRVGQRPDDISYEKGAKKRMEAIGISWESYVFPEEITHKEFLERFQEINQDSRINGILLLRPLPSQIDEKAIEQTIDPSKDVDGISPVNMAKIFAGDDSGFAPCTAEAVMEMLHYAGISLSGKRVSVVGRSLVVGKPLTMLLLKQNATVTVCHTRTADLEGTLKQAEIIAVCAGKANMLNQSHVGKDAIVIDVGINMDENNKLCGDVDLESIRETAALASPVPGGVGTVTTSVLAKHVIKAARLQNTGNDF